MTNVHSMGSRTKQKNGFNQWLIYVEFIYSQKYRENTLAFSLVETVPNRYHHHTRTPHHKILQIVDCPTITPSVLMVC